MMFFRAFSVTVAVGMGRDDGGINLCALISTYITRQHISSSKLQGLVNDLLFRHENSRGTLGPGMALLVPLPGLKILLSLPSLDISIDLLPS